MAVNNSLIGEKTCPRCEGTGKLSVWLAPLPCEPECVKNLRFYHMSENKPYWLCDAHPGFIPTLWREEERDRCLEELK